MKNERIRLKTLKESMEFNDKYQGVASVQFAGAVKDINANKEKYDKRMKELMDKYKPDDRFAHTKVKGTEAQKKMHLSESNFKIIGKKKPLKESVNQNDLAKFIEDSVIGLQNGDATNYRYKLDDRLAVFVGWQSGYGDEDRDDVIQDIDNRDSVICAGIKVWTSDDHWVDYEYLNYPYFESGDIIDTGISIEPDEDYNSLANWLMKTYNSMKGYDIDEDGKILNESKKVKSVKKALKESLSNSKYKDLIGKHFDYSMDFDFLDIVADTMERRDSYIADGQSEEEALDNALDFVYNYDLEQIVDYYFYNKILDDYQVQAIQLLKNDIEKILSESGDIKESLKEDKGIDIWLASCSGKLDKIKKYFEDGGEVNHRHKAFGVETSNIMGALRNGQYDAAKLLQSYGETILDDELEQYNTYKYRSMPYSPLTENLKESKSLKESYGPDVIYDLEDRAKSWMRDGYNLEDAIERAIDDGLIYSEDIIALGSHYGVIDDGELIGKFYDDLYSDMTNDLADYADELEDEGDEEDDESLKESIDIKSFKTVPHKHLKGNFRDVVRHLQRPYTEISKDDYKYIMDLTGKDDTDFVEKDGIMYTFGDADGGYALMPYVESLEEDTIKQGNSWVNKGKEGTHGKFKTKKEADAQRKAMFANTNPKTRDFGESIEEDTNINIGTVNVKAKVKVKNKEINGEEIEDKKEIKVKDEDKVEEGYNLCEGDVDKERCKDILNHWIDWEQVDETGDVDFAIDQLRSLHTEGEITDDEYDYITVNWDDLLESCQNKDNNKSVEEDYAVVNKKTKRVTKPMTFEKKDDAVKMKQSLVSLMGIPEEELDIVDVNSEEENLDKSQTYPVESPFDKEEGESGLRKEQKFPVESPFESKDKKAAKDMKENLNEDVKIILSNGIDNFIPWSDEATETWEKIKEAGKLQSLAFMLEDMYPDGISETQLNDYLRFESEWLFDMLNMSGKKLIQDSISVEGTPAGEDKGQEEAPVVEQKEKSQNELLKNEIDLNTAGTFAVDDEF